MQPNVQKFSRLARLRGMGGAMSANGNTRCDLVSELSRIANSVKAKAAANPDVALIYYAVAEEMRRAIRRHWQASQCEQCRLDEQEHAA